MASPARRHRGDTGVDGTLGREVAELAIHIVLPSLIAGMLIVGEGDRLSGLGDISLAPGTAALDEREARQREDASESADQPVFFHFEATAPWRSINTLENGRKAGIRRVRQRL